MVGSAESPFLGCRLPTSHSILTWWRGGERNREVERQRPFVTLIRALISFRRAWLLWPYLNLITFQRPNLLILSHWALGLQHVNFKGMGHKHPAHNRWRIPIQMQNTHIWHLLEVWPDSSCCGIVSTSNGSSGFPRLIPNSTTQKKTHELRSRVLWDPGARE